MVGKPEGSTPPALKLSSDGFKHHGLYHGISKGKVQPVLDSFYQGSATGKFDYKLTFQPFKNMFIGRPRVISCGCRLRMRPPGLTIYLPRIHLTFILQSPWEFKWNSSKMFRDQNSVCIPYLHHPQPHVQPIVTRNNSMS